MSSSVFFRFKNQKDVQRVTFDGTGISVFELKRDIINMSRLGDGTDFDFNIYNLDTNEEYNDDTSIISRGTTVLARRLPATKPGAGRAARYVSGKMPVMAKNQHRIEPSKSAAASRTPMANGAAQDPNSNMTEEEKIAAMFQAGGAAWEQQQQEMANQKAVHRPGGFNKMANVPDKPLPPGYTCHRCGEKGHWIQACPTNNDPAFENRPKFRRTTGIPRSFLKVVEKPTALSSDGTVDISQLPAGVMYTATGEWVVARPDEAAWEQFQAKAKAAADKAEAANTGSQELSERGLECPIDKRMFVDPMKTPCCGKTYCRDCIENALLENDFVCPGCSSDNTLVDNLIPDEEAVTKIKVYEEDKAKMKLEKEKEKSATPPPTEQQSTKEAATATDRKSNSPKPASANGEKSATSTPQLAAATESKKRPAEEELENSRIPTGPAAMRKQNNASQPPAQGSFDQNNFIQSMNALANQQGMQGMGNFNPAMGMGFPGMMGMPMNMMGMPNPMMMNGGWGGMGFMNNGMNGMGFPQQQQQQQRGGNMYGGGYNNQMMGQNGGYGQGQGQQWQGNQNWNNATSNNQQQQQQQQQPQGEGDDGAYIRRPVNPHRHQARNRRQRSVDYREM
ncbi:DWNN-domain-containing protein [Aureobasidium pullulans]|uniref:DWNN-domain-containing protein n=1 Tax=Aureobasidium pullulans TaxID=5580 RepID=A0A1A7MIR6_AURPU|nr:MAG: Cysteine proteinase [Aureobasidium pullulans]THW07228.1 DWNN-domain-containing protein [Aureobasidium pullulans]THW47700.1 DWNN-domain-containing protein [Aureobasidium pullulans]THY48582.1 DWNN-domain-containing protein [Aureobasidium pullulans]THZ80252.1 DWNN-domain-containing protein [Aureobasidium pullulans]